MDCLEELATAKIEETDASSSLSNSNKLNDDGIGSKNDNIQFNFLDSFGKGGNGNRINNTSKTQNTTYWQNISIVFRQSNVQTSIATSSVARNTSHTQSTHRATPTLARSNPFFLPAIDYSPVSFHAGMAWHEVCTSHGMGWPACESQVRRESNLRAVSSVPTTTMRGETLRYASDDARRHNAPTMVS